MADDTSETFLGLKLVERYQITEEIARGALSTVYRGNDLILKRSVAIKAAPPEWRETYRASLTATTTLAHPATIALYDAIEHDGWLFLVQEYINAQSITAYLKQGVPSARAVDIGLQLARAVDHAHRRNMTHGDLTPSAILVDRHAVVRVNNFGLPPDTEYFERMRAMLEADLGILDTAILADDDAKDTAILPETLAETVVETPVEGASDPLADDLRAVGYVLWQLLSEPQGADTAGRRVLRPDVSASVADLVRRCCAAPGEEAISDAGALIVALEQVAETLANERPAVSTVTPPALRAARTAIEEAAAWALEETLANDQMYAVPVHGKTGAPVASAATAITDPGSGDLAATQPSLDAEGVMRPGIRLPARSYPDESPPLPEYPPRFAASWPGGTPQSSTRTAPGVGGLTLGVALLLGAALFVIFFIVGYLLPVTLGSGR